MMNLNTYIACLGTLQKGNDRATARDLCLSAMVVEVTERIPPWVSVDSITAGLVQCPTKEGCSGCVLWR